MKNNLDQEVSIASLVGVHTEEEIEKLGLPITYVQLEKILEVTNEQKPNGSSKVRELLLAIKSKFQCIEFIVKNYWLY